MKHKWLTNLTLHPDSNMVSMKCSPKQASMTGDSHLYLTNMQKRWRPSSSCRWHNVRDQSGISRGSIQDQSGISQGSIREQSGTSQGSIGDQSGINQGSISDQSGVNWGSIRNQSGINQGSIGDPPGWMAWPCRSCMAFLRKSHHNSNRNNALTGIIRCVCTNYNFLNQTTQNAFYFNKTKQCAKFRHIICLWQATNRQTVI